VIARLWRGWVAHEKAAAYVAYVTETGIAGYLATPGNRGAQLLTREVGGGRTEIVTLSWWDTLDDVKAFAGDDVDVARYYPEDDEYLVDRETTVSHFTVADPPA
jgi:heme-degrading monooxygenase HmoA